MYEQELQKLQKLWNQGLFANPFYQDKISDKTYLESYDSFCKIPFMRKEDIRKTDVFERTTTKMEDVFGIFSSSGSTGEKTCYVFNKMDRLVQEQCAKRFLNRVGIGNADIGGVFSPVDTGIMAQTMMWQFTSVGAAYVNCPEPSPDNIVNLLEQIPVTVISTRPEVMTITDPVYHESLQNSSVRVLLPGGGFITEGRRKYLEKLWNAQCYNFYGMSEVFGPLAAECVEKNGQHYPMEYLMIEVVDPDTGEPVKKGEAGIAVYTTLWYKGFPLLRYWTDDFIRLDDRQCACGSDWPRLHYLGRKSDCLSVGNRYYFPKEFEELLFNYGIYEDYRVKCLGESLKIQIESCEEVSNILKEEIENFFGMPCKIETVPVGTLGIYRKHQNHFEKG